MFVLIFVDLPLHELATANEAAPDALDLSSGTLDPIVLPLKLEHIPCFLNGHGCLVFVVSVLLSLI